MILLKRYIEINLMIHSLTFSMDYIDYFSCILSNPSSLLYFDEHDASFIVALVAFKPSNKMRFFDPVNSKQGLKRFELVHFGPLPELKTH